MNKIVPLSLLGVATMIMPIKVNSAEYKEITINAQSSVKIIAKAEEMHNDGCSLSRYRVLVVY